MGRRRVHGPCPLSRVVSPVLASLVRQGWLLHRSQSRQVGWGRDSGGAQRKRQKQNTVWQVEQRESDLNNRILGVWFVCERKGEKKDWKKRRKGGERDPILPAM